MRESVKFWLGGAAAMGVALASACVDDAASAPEATDAGPDSGALPEGGGSDSSTVTDAADAGTADAARCDLSKPFGTPQVVPNIPALDGGVDNNVTLSTDELTMYLTSN